MQNQRCRRHSGRGILSKKTTRGWFGRTTDGVNRRLRVETLENRYLLSTFSVWTTADSGDGSLRQAIELANANGDAVTDEIRFDIPGTGPHTIQPLTQLPNISSPVTIDGTTQDGFDGTPVIELDGSAASNGLWVAADGCTVRGLAINRFGWAGIVLVSDNNTVEGNYIGTDIAGTSDAGNLFGVVIASSSGNRIGTNGDGANDAGERNVISGNDEAGIVVEGYGGGGNNSVAGNYIGTDFTGTAAIANRNGVALTGGASDNVIGIDGTDGVFNESERNIISGNTRAGVDASWTEGSSRNVIAGNYIGTDKTGALPLPNERGIWFEMGPQGNRIGTDGDGVADNMERNVISGNSLDGVYLWTNSNSNTVAGNYIGTDADGNAALPNLGYGIWVREASYNCIGTDGIGDFIDAERNVISGNGLNGVYISEDASYNTLAGNYIGVDADGLQPIGNGYDPGGLSNSWYDEGVWLHQGAHHNWIGTNSDGQGDEEEGNVISANHGSGVRLRGWDGGADYNVIAGNYIGTDCTGLVGLGNGESGILFDEGPKYNRIGTNGDGIADEAERNVISANAGDGVVLSSEGTDYNQITGNSIGTDLTGSGELGNGGNGAGAWWGAKDNQIGGSPVLANTIAFNGQAGVVIHTGWPVPSINNSVQVNSIHSNGGLGIDFGPNGIVEGNDPLDADDGPNHLQNYPENLVVKGGSTTTVTGSLNSTPNTNFVLDFYANATADPSGHGEGERWLGSFLVTTDEYGNVSFGETLAAASASGEAITATATDADGNTSEFSAAVLLTNTPPEINDDDLVLSTSTVFENDEVTLYGSFTDPDSDDAHAIRISWGDGLPDTVINLSPGVMNFESTHQYLDDDPTGTPADVNIITVVVSDVESTDSADASVVVNNVAPQLGSVSVTPWIADDGIVTLVGDIIDPGTQDTFDLTVNWGDGDIETFDYVEGSEDFLLSHQYLESGLFTVELTLSDDDTGAHVALDQARVTGAAVHDGELQIIGTITDDNVVVGKLWCGQIVVIADFLPGCLHLARFDAAGIERIDVVLGDGDDHAVVAANVYLPTKLDGGFGDDFLKGGSGDDILVGGNGLDLLVGGPGRDLLIGGRDCDRIVGNRDDDILISGYSVFDANDAALMAIMAEWTSGRDYGTRIDNLRGVGSGDRENGDFFLIGQNSDAFDPAATILDDDARDVLTGGSGLDWFLANYNHDDEGRRDRITDLSSSEFANDIDWIEEEVEVEDPEGGP
ncbi:MAG: hypothetical protein JXM70_06735 [Pirellulales bacterium]|nr:hypothetical protein [Pirellulales bacterium]